MVYLTVTRGNMTKRIIAVVNQKGGVGKTTTAENVAAQLATPKQPVLLLDLDPQGNATSGLGLPKADLKVSTYEVLCHDVKLQDAVQETRIQGLSILPTNTNLTGAEVELVSQDRREFKLK